MKRYIFLLLPIILAILILPGCGNDDMPEITSMDYPEFTAIFPGTPTRASGTSWDEGDMVGISYSPYNIDFFNRCHLVDKNTGTLTVAERTKPFGFADDKEIVFTAYYPMLDIKNFTTTGNNAGKTKSISSSDQKNQKNFDFLWAEASGSRKAPNVKFNFKHSMSRLLITLKPGDSLNYEFLKTAKITLKYFYLSGQFDSNTGTASRSSSSSRTSSKTFNDLDCYYDDNKKTVTFSFILFPQTLIPTTSISVSFTNEDGTTFSPSAVMLDFSGANQEFDGNNENALIGGLQYNITAIVNRYALTSVTSSISAWNEVSMPNIDVE